MVKRVEAPQELKEKALEMLKKGFEGNKENLMFKFENKSRRLDEDQIIEYKDEIQEQMDDTRIIAVLTWKNEDDEVMSIPVNKGMVNQWNTSEDEIFEACKENVENEVFYLKGMYEVMTEMTGSDLPDIIPVPEEESMYCLTNKAKLNGARVILSKYVKDFLKTQFGEYFIIPSSIHELLIVPVGRTDGGKEALEEIVKQVNETQVDERDLLSYKVAEIR